MGFLSSAIDASSCRSCAASTKGHGALAAYKDQKEDLEDLMAQDIPMRATLRNMPLFQYVRDIQVQAEKDALRPPNPVLSDLGRGARNSPKARTASSLSPTGRKGLSMQKSLTKSFRR